MIRRRRFPFEPFIKRFTLDADFLMVADGTLGLASDDFAKGLSVGDFPHRCVEILHQIRNQFVIEREAFPDPFTIPVQAGGLREGSIHEIYAFP